MTGINSLKNLIGLSFSLVTPIVKEVKKDGFQPTDLIAFIDSEDFKGHVKKLTEDWRDIPSEIKDLNAIEGVELGYYIYGEVRDLISAIR